jgi:hypothetical protein
MLEENRKWHKLIIIQHHKKSRNWKKKFVDVAYKNAPESSLIGISSEAKDEEVTEITKEPELSFEQFMYTLINPELAKIESPKEEDIIFPEILYMPH